MKLSRLEKVELRNVWKHEALDFTNWLAEPENLTLLSEEIGIDISLIQTEASVGKFSVDILAEEEQTERKIVIENQLETTDHNHLGKIITYASGFDAEIIVWIVREVRDEHKQAIDWLNEHTDEKINFFVIKMEVWQICDSPYAPKFYVVSQPNDWAKAIKQTSTQPSKVSQTKLLQLEFREKFREFAQSKNSKIRLGKPYPQHWFAIRIGISDAHIELTVSSLSGLIGSEIYIPASKELFAGLENLKEDIHRELGFELEWAELLNRKASRIRVLKPVVFSDTNQWEKYFHWLLEKTEELQRVFPKYIKTLKN
jgi:hypothetical protein